MALDGTLAFGLRIPDGWVEYDLSGEALAGIRAALMKETPNKAERDRINETFRNVRRIAQGAQRRGAVYAAGTFTMYEDGLLMANVMIFKVTPPPGRSFSLHELSKEFSAAGGRQSEGTARTFGTVELPGIGPVGRVKGIEEAEVSHGIRTKLAIMHTVVPFPDESGQVLVITCSSPNLPLAEPLYDVFDAITSTFSFGVITPS
ncbi:hypothetical protein ACFWVC_36330 [Streptomyces sp. NPDC058691]|uniref:hypothetical protein n=1 Tax=Streptomyces sp. NPDC058691 TaxID=3346601 RepID=UPI0036658D98